MMTFAEVRAAQAQKCETLTLDDATFQGLCVWCHNYYDRANDASNGTMMAFAIADWLERIEREDAEYALRQGFERCAEIFEQSTR